MAVLPEVDFGLDNFKQPKVLSKKDSVVQIILSMFFLRPGNYPSMPHIGINISKYLYATEGELDPEELKRDIFNQCSELMEEISIGDVQVAIVDVNGTGTLVVVLPLTGDFNDEGVETNVLTLGFQQSLQGNVLFNYRFVDASAFN